MIKILKNIKKSTKNHDIQITTSNTEDAATGSSGLQRQPPEAEASASSVGIGDDDFCRQLDKFLAWAGDEAVTVDEREQRWSRVSRKYADPGIKTIYFAFKMRTALLT